MNIPDQLLPPAPDLPALANLVDEVTTDPMDAVPAELRGPGQWVLWRYRASHGRRMIRLALLRLPDTYARLVANGFLPGSHIGDEAGKKRIPCVNEALFPVSVKKSEQSLDPGVS